MTSVSFIIPHMGREELLIETLTSIEKLDSSNIQLQVIVVSKNESFSPQLMAFNTALDIQFLQVNQDTTISDQRNIGVKNSSSEFLAFIDADIALSNNWLQVMLSEVNHESFALISAVQRPSRNATQLELVRVTLSNLSIDCEMEFLPGRNLFLSREVFNKTDGFPSDLITCEDYVFTHNVSKFGKLYYTSKADYVHLGEDKEYWSMARKEVWRGQSNLASVKGRDVPISEYPSFIVPPLFTLALIASFLFIALNWNILSYLSIFVWVFLLGVYTVRLYKKRHKYLRLFPIVLFYSLYFPARTVGTILGAKTTFKTGDY